MRMLKNGGQHWNRLATARDNARWWLMAGSDTQEQEESNDGGGEYSRSLKNKGLKLELIGLTEMGDSAWRRVADQMKATLR